MKKSFSLLLILLCGQLYSQMPGMKPGDTLRFYGFPTNVSVPAELLYWVDNDNIIHYSESWKAKGNIFFKREGSIWIGKDSVSLSFLFRFSRNDVLKTFESVTPTGDSVIIIANFGTKSLLV